MRSRATFLAVIAALLVLAGCSPDPPEGDTPGERSENVAQEAPSISDEEIPEEEPVARVAAQLQPSVVQVNVQGVQSSAFGQEAVQGQGSGVIYRQDGFIVTNNHVVQGADEVEVGFADGTTETGEVVGGDPFTDLAVIQVDRDDLPPASFAGDRAINVGQLAVAIGSPSGFESTVTEGVISGLNREVPAQFTGGTQEASLVDLVQTDAPISPGSSGGALANRDGEVVGINVAYLPPAETGAESIGFAIPAATAVSTADQIIATGEASNPYLGVSLTELTPETAERFGAETGALIENAESGEPAAQAGLRTGDVITSVDGAEVESTADLLSILRGYTPGDTVEVTAERGGNEQAFEVTLGERT